MLTVSRPASGSGSADGSGGPVLSEEHGRIKAIGRQRGELVPIGDALSGMGGPVKAIREATPQALHHFTRFDQVNQLAEASEADPDRGFMARLLSLCSLPRTNPGNRLQHIPVRSHVTLGAVPPAPGAYTPVLKPVSQPQVLM